MAPPEADLLGLLVRLTGGGRPVGAADLVAAFEGPRWAEMPPLTPTLARLASRGLIALDEPQPYDVDGRLLISLTPRGRRWHRLLTPTPLDRRRRLASGPSIDLPREATGS